MRSHPSTRRSRALHLLLVCVSLLFIVPAANAQEIYGGDALPTGESVANDIVLVGDQVFLNGSVEGDAILLGRTISISGDVDGSLIAMGENIVVNGTATGTTYVLGLNLDLLSGAELGRNLYFVGGSITADPESSVGRDLRVLAMGARLAGTVERDTRMVVGLFQIARALGQRINLMTTGQNLDGSTPTVAGAGDLLQLMAASPVALGQAAQTAPQAQDEEPDGATADDQVREYIVSHLQDLASLLIVGILLIWFRPAWLNGWAAAVRQKPLAAVGWGFVAYIVGFAGAGLLFALVIAVGVGLLWTTLTGLSFTWTGIAVSAWGFVFSTFVLLVAFVSKIIVGYLIGLLILQRFAPRSAARMFLPLLLGAVLFILVSAMPYFGWVFALVSTFLGLGGVWLLRTQSGTARPPASATAAPA